MVRLTPVSLLHHGKVMPVLRGRAGCWAAWSCGSVQRVWVPGGQVGAAISRVPAGPVSPGRAGPPQHSHASLILSGWAAARPRQSHLVGLGPQSRRAAPRINDGPAWPRDSVSTIGTAFISPEGVPHPKGDERSEWRGDRGERSEQRARPELAKGLRGFSGILP